LDSQGFPSNVIPRWLNTWNANRNVIATKPWRQGDTLHVQIELYDQNKMLLDTLYIIPPDSNMVTLFLE
jgi:hypothetical protein